MSWAAIESGSLATQLTPLLESLLVHLQTERDAIAAFDSDAIEQVQADKESLLAEIEELRVSEQNDKPIVAVSIVDQESRQQEAGLSALGHKVRAEARINAVLLRECSGLLVDALGGQESATAYDNKARCVTMKFPPVAVTAA